MIREFVHKESVVSDKSFEVNAGVSGVSGCNTG